ncbi:hypothetical protein B1R94_27585 [Mycolicibacterium litorale]|nr:hypothetical protein B1R94_27585 [Mycolicibacterium litorale]
MMHFLKYSDITQSALVTGTTTGEVHVPPELTPRIAQLDNSRRRAQIGVWVAAVSTQALYLLLGARELYNHRSAQSIAATVAVPLVVLALTGARYYGTARSIAVAVAATALGYPLSLLMIVVAVGGAQTGLAIPILLGAVFFARCGAALVVLILGLLAVRWVPPRRGRI